MVLLALLGCVSGPQGGRRLNLMPLLFYSSNPSQDTARLELLGPLFSRERVGTDTITTLAPLLCWRERGARREGEFLYPLGWYRREPAGSRFSFLPFSRYHQERPGGGTDGQFFLLFWGRTPAGAAYGGLFPLGGTFRERFGRESITFILWPLFSTSTGDGSRHYKVLWPFFSYSQGKESGFTFWPLFGKITRAGVYDKYYALWPLLHYQRLRLDTEQPRTVKAALPFYLEDTTPTSRWRGLFFSHYVQEQGHYSQWNLPWPFIVRGDGEQFTLRSFWPFYYHRSDRDSDRLQLFWPLYARTREEKSDRLMVQHRWLLFSVYRYRLEPEGGWTEQGRLWPLFYFEGQCGRGQAHAPDLVPIRSKGWSRIYGPWLYLWSQERQGQSCQGRALWGLYRWERNPGYRLWELGFLASRQVTPERSSFRLLSGLLTWERRGSIHHLRLFYLPWGLTWEQ